MTGQGVPLAMMSTPANGAGETGRIESRALIAAMAAAWAVVRPAVPGPGKVTSSVLSSPSAWPSSGYCRPSLSVAASWTLAGTATGGASTPFMPPVAPAG